MRALVQLPEVHGSVSPELRLFEVGGMPRRVPAEALGLDGWRGRRLAWRLPRRVVGLLSSAGLGADRLLGGVDLFHRVQADWPPVGARVPQLVAVSELPHADSTTARALRALGRSGAHALVFSSEARLPVAAALEVAPDRVHAVTVGADHAGWAATPPRVEPADGPARLLVLGALRLARQPLAVLRAFEVLARGRAGAELVFCGAEGDAAGELRAALAASPVRDAVELVPPGETRMSGLLRDADVLVHFSEAEWTAVTPLEAFRYGAAVVASRLAAFEEGLGAHAQYVDEPSADSAETARAMALALDGARDPAARAARRERAARFTWVRNARETVRVWETVLASPRP